MHLVHNNLQRGSLPSRPVLSVHTQHARVIYILTEDSLPPPIILPEVNVLQVAHSSQSTQVQALHPVSCHGEPVHGAQPLQHGGDVSEVVERQPETVELSQAGSLFGEEAEVVSIQRQRLQATRWRTENNSSV